MCVCLCMLSLERYYPVPFVKVSICSPFHSIHFIYSFTIYTSSVTWIDLKHWSPHRHRLRRRRRPFVHFIYVHTITFASVFVYCNPGVHVFFMWLHHQHQSFFHFLCMCVCVYCWLPQ